MTSPKTGQVLGLVGIAIACIVLMIGCAANTQTASAPSRDSSNEVMARFERGFMNSADLPAGWNHRRAAVESRLGGIGRLVTYYGDNPDRQPLVSVNQTIVIYPSQADAESAFRAEVPRRIPPQYANDWRRPPELTLPTQADDAELGCLPATVNNMQMQTCVVLARYGDMLVVLSGQVFDEHWMTMRDFAHLVDRVNQRMQSARPPITMRFVSPGATSGSCIDCKMLHRSNPSQLTRSVA